MQSILWIIQDSDTARARNFCSQRMPSWHAFFEVRFVETFLFSKSDYNCHLVLYVLTQAILLELHLHLCLSAQANKRIRRQILPTPGLREDADLGRSWSLAACTLSVQLLDCMHPRPPRKHLEVFIPLRTLRTQYELLLREAQIVRDGRRERTFRKRKI